MDGIEEKEITGGESGLSTEETPLVANDTLVAVNETPVAVNESSVVVKESPNRIYIDGERWFTYKQLASILHCTPQSVYNYVRSGKVKTKKIDGVSFYRLDEYM